MIRERTFYFINVANFHSGSFHAIDTGALGRSSQSIPSGAERPLGEAVEVLPDAREQQPSLV
jgi:hypothetical protein